TTSAPFPRAPESPRLTTVSAGFRVLAPEARVGACGRTPSLAFESSPPLWDDGAVDCGPGAAMPDLVIVDPKIMGGKPVVAGTRITVEYILDQLGHGHTVQELLDGHPRLTKEGIEAAVAYAIDAVRAERV